MHKKIDNEVSVSRRAGLKLALGAAVLGASIGVVSEARAAQKGVRQNIKGEVDVLKSAPRSSDKITRSSIKHNGKTVRENLK